MTIQNRKYVEQHFIHSIDRHADDLEEFAENCEGMIGHFNESQLKNAVECLRLAVRYLRRTTMPFPTTTDPNPFQPLHQKL